MKRLRIDKIYIPVFFIFLFIALLPLSASEASSLKPVLTKSFLSLEKGTSYRLRVENGIGEVTWSTSDRSVAKVSTSGRITAKKAGTCKIYADMGKTRLTCRLTVYNNYSADNGTYSVSGFSTLMGKLPLKKFKYKDDEENLHFKELSGLGSKCCVFFGVSGNGKEVILDGNNYVYFFKNINKCLKSCPDNPFLDALASACETAVQAEPAEDANGKPCFLLMMQESDLYVLDSDNRVFDGDDTDEGYILVFYANRKGTDYDCIMIGCDEESYEHIQWEKHTDQ